VLIKSRDNSDNASGGPIYRISDDKLTINLKIFYKSSPWTNAYRRPLWRYRPTLILKAQYSRNIDGERLCNGTVSVCMGAEVVVFHSKLEGKYSLESTDPRESEIRAHLRP